jgi:hypothetical protein
MAVEQDVTAAATISEDTEDAAGASTVAHPATGPRHSTHARCPISRAYGPH